MGIMRAQRAADFQYVYAVKCNKLRHCHIFFSILYKKIHLSICAVFSLVSAFLFFFTSVLQCSQTVYMKIYSLPWGESKISREVTYKWQGGESDLIDWPQALYIKIGKAYREEGSRVLLGEALCSSPSFLCPCLSALVSLVPFFVLPMLRWC